MTFRMNWYDFENNRFQYDGIIYNLYQRKYDKVLVLRTRIMFLLNIYRGRWVTSNDLIEFLYNEINPDDWPDHERSVLCSTIYHLRPQLPDGVKIIGSRSFGYKLNVSEEK